MSKLVVIIRNFVHADRELKISYHPNCMWFPAFSVTLSYSDNNPNLYSYKYLYQSILTEFDLLAHAITLLVLY